MEQAAKYQPIIEILEESTECHLITGLQLLPDETKDALLAMIETETRSIRRTEVRYHVVQDVAAILAGNQEAHLYCVQYMRPADGEAHVCGKCGKHGTLTQTQVPNTDIRFLCGECLKTYQMFTNTIGVL